MSAAAHLARTRHCNLVMTSSSRPMRPTRKILRNVAGEQRQRKAIRLAELRQRIPGHLRKSRHDQELSEGKQLETRSLVAAPFVGKLPYGKRAILCRVTSFDSSASSDETEPGSVGVISIPKPNHQPR